MKWLGGQSSVWSEPRMSQRPQPVLASFCGFLDILPSGLLDFWLSFCFRLDTTSEGTKEPLVPVALTCEIFDIIKFWYKSITIRHSARLTTHDGQGTRTKDKLDRFTQAEDGGWRLEAGQRSCLVSRTPRLQENDSGIPLVINLVIKTLLFMTITSDVRGRSRWRPEGGQKSSK